MAARVQRQPLKPATLTALDAADALWAAIDEARRTRLNVPSQVGRPPNSFTVSEYGARYGCSETTAAREIAALVASGVLVKQRVMAPICNGRVCAINVYCEAAK